MPKKPTLGICEPASTIIEYLGGVKSVSNKLGITERKVRDWRMPRENKGRNGKVPKKWHYDIITWCIEEDKPFTINHFDDATELKGYMNYYT